MKKKTIGEWLFLFLGFVGILAVFIIVNGFSLLLLWFILFEFK